MVKIDPPLWDSCSLEELGPLAFQYKRKLQELSELAENGQVEFFNAPRVIWELLDKRACKEKLLQAGVPVTEMLEEWKAAKSAQGSGQKGGRYGSGCQKADGSESTGQEKDGQKAMRLEHTQQLLELMQQAGICQVFIKPVYGSGAAGVSAFRFQPATGRMALYTCALLHPEHGLVNTKRLRRFSDPKDVIPLLECILQLDCVLERWYAKADFHGEPYDLRAVVLDGRVEFLLGRLSKGPVTNLHLNNHPMEAAALGIPEHMIEEICMLCKKSMDCFAGLRCAGIDLLLEKGSLRPRVIEMNAQGDLIYQDIFKDNKIYRKQAELIRQWLRETMKFSGKNSETMRFSGKNSETIRFSGENSETIASIGKNNETGRGGGMVWEKFR